MHTTQMNRVVVVMAGKPPKVGNEPKIDSYYVGFEELNSCSSIDEEDLVSNGPKYSEFNEG